MTNIEKADEIQKRLAEIGASRGIVNAKTNRVALIFDEDGEHHSATIYTNECEKNKYLVGRPLFDMNRCDSTGDEFLASVEMAIGV